MTISTVTAHPRGRAPRRRHANRLRAAGVGLSALGIATAAVGTTGAPIHAAARGLTSPDLAGGTLYYTRYQGGGDRVRSISFSYDGSSFSFAQKSGANDIKDVANTPGADGLVFSPSGKLIVGGQGDRVYAVNPAGGSFSTVTAGGTDAYHVTMDPGGKKAWTGGIPAGLASIPVDPAQNGTAHPLSGADQQLDSLAFDLAHYSATAPFAFYTASGPSGEGGHFGCIDLQTFTTHRLLETSAAHGLAYDPFSSSLLLFGANLIAQVTPPTTCNAQTTASISHSKSFSFPGNGNPAGGQQHFDQGTVDAKGHIYVAVNDGYFAFVDYSTSGDVSAPTHSFVTYLDDHLDDVAPLSGPGSPKLTTTPQPGSQVTIGTAIHDRATVTNGAAGDVVTFNLYKGGKDGCSAATKVFGPVQGLLGSDGLADSPAYTPLSTGTYQWTADHKDAVSACGLEQVLVEQAATQLTTRASNGSLGGAISDSASVSGGPVPFTGTVTFKAFGPADLSCSKDPAFVDSVGIASGGSASTSFSPVTHPGTYRWTAAYSGDAVHSSSSEGCGGADETSTVAPHQSGIDTHASRGGTVGTVIHDSARVAGYGTPTGTVTFRLYAPAPAGSAVSPCDPSLLVRGYSSSVPLVEGAASSADYTTSAVGTYHWIAAYSGDADNTPQTGGCNDENESSTTQQAQPSLATAATSSVTVGQSISDLATVSGGFSPTGTVSFKLYAPAAASSTVSPCDPSLLVSGYSSTVSLADGKATAAAYDTQALGAYHWVATYNGDADNRSVSGACADSAEQSTVTAAQPAITTVPSSGGTAGTAVLDNAAVSGGFNPTGAVRFDLFSSSDCSGSPVFSSQTGLGSDDTARSASFTPTLAGTYQWVATYLGDAHNHSAVSACGSELVTITPQAGTQGLQTGTNSGPGSAPDTGSGLQLRLGLLLTLLGLASTLLSLRGAPRQRRRRA